MNLETENSNVQDSSVVAEPVEKMKMKMKILPIILFLLLLVLGSLTYIFLIIRKDEVIEVPHENDPEFVEEEELEEITEGPAGEIYLTLSPLGTEKPNIYKLDVETMELEEFFPDSPYGNYMAKFSSDLSKMVFVREYEDETSNLILYTESTREYVELTNRAEFFPRNPVFSSDNRKIVYWVYEGEEDFAPIAEDNNIYLLDINTGEIEKVAMGAFPVFSANGDSIFFLKTGGIYILSLLTGNEFLLIEDSNEALIKDPPGLPSWLTFRINFLPEQNLLVLTNTVSSYISIFHVSTDSSFELFAGGDQFTPIFTPNWPVFSRAGGFLAVQGFFLEEGSEDNFSPSLKILSLEELKSFKMKSLEDFEKDAIWISDWIIR